MDSVKHPQHYAEGRKYEPKDVIRDWGLNFNLGSAVKYISRAGRKGEAAEDLRKAIQFLIFEVEALTGGQNIDMIFYDKEETHENCTVQILTNSLTGKQSIGWWKNEDQA